MAADDRKRRIMEHLAMSSDRMKFLSPKKSTETPAASASPPPPPTPTPAPAPVPSTARAGDRKKRIMDHVARSSANFGDFSLDEKERKKQILEHLRKSIS
jgi:hypothetical protein